MSPRWRLGGRRKGSRATEKPIPCQWMATCGNEATQTRPHPIMVLGMVVAVCDRCAGEENP